MTKLILTPRHRALEHLKAALATGVRGAAREAIQHAIQTVEDDGRSDLTEMAYRNLQTGKTLADPRRPGFRMRANKSSKLWLYRFDWHGKQVEMRLGTYPEVSLQVAREKWQTARTRRLKGEHPEAQAEGSTGPLPTVRELCERYLDKYAEVVKRTADEDRRQLEKDFLPLYGNKRVDELQPEHISAALHKIIDRGAPRSAEKLRACLSTVFQVARGKSRKINYKDGPWLPKGFRDPMDEVTQLAKRDPFSSDLKISEVRSFLQNLETLHPTVAQALRFQFETCARIGEVTGLPWSEIDLDEGVWTLPAERSKNKEPHRVMLSRQSLAVLKELQPMQAVSEYVFPAIKDPRKPLSRATVDEAIQRHRKALGLPERGSTHMLRHTTITQLASLGCPREVRDRISNHKPQGIDALYQKHEFDREAREWLQKWADQLQAWATPNVRVLERA